MLAQVEGVGQAGRGALDSSGPARKSPAEAGLVSEGVAPGWGRWNITSFGGD